jgi:uroporphyrin-III C-methyltransferase
MTTKEDEIEAGDSTTAKAAAPPRPPRRGGAWASLAFLCSVAALAGVAYLYWMVVYEPDPLAPRLAALERRVEDAERQAPAPGDPGAMRAELERIAAGLRRSLAEDVRAAAESSGPSPTLEPSTPPAPRDWQLAEARYLLRLANHRLLLERDAAGAAALLAAADEVLVAVDDFSLHDVRARIAEERLALASVPALDAEGLFLQLEAIKRDLDRLPLRLPELAPAPSAVTEPASWWEAVRAEIGKLVRFRQFEGAVRPLLAPEEAVYLELNLRLMLERAQLAGLRREQTIYDQSIAVAVDWIERYLDVTAPEVRRVLEGLRALASVSLAAPLPDISGSLDALNALDAEPRSGS